MADQPKLQRNRDTFPLAKKRLIRGLIAIVASMGIALLIRTGIAETYPSLKLAYIGCAAVGLWGLIDIIRGIFSH